MERGRNGMIWLVTVGSGHVDDDSLFLAAVSVGFAGDGGRVRRRRLAV